MKGVVNLTPHGVRIVNEQGKVIKEIPASGQVARLQEKEIIIGTLEGVPIFQKTLEEVEGLPPEKEGTLYIVSLPIAQACPGRRDLLVPHKLVRDEQGIVIGCMGLASLHQEGVRE